MPSVSRIFQNLDQGRSEERAPKPAALELAVKSESADEHGRHGIVASQMLVAVTASSLPFGKGKAVERVVPEDALGFGSPGRSQGDIRCRGVLRFIPGNDASQVVIERRVPA